MSPRSVAIVTVYSASVSIVISGALAMPHALTAGPMRARRAPAGPARSGAGDPRVEAPRGVARDAGGDELAESLPGEHAEQRHQPVEVEGLFELVLLGHAGLEQPAEGRDEDPHLGSSAPAVGDGLEPLATSV